MAEVQDAPPNQARSALLERVRRLFLALSLLLLLVECVEWVDADTAIVPRRLVAAAAIGLAAVCCVRLYRRARPSGVGDLALAVGVTAIGWGLGREGAVLALLLGWMLLRSLFGTRRGVAVAFSMVVVAYLAISLLVIGVAGVTDLGNLTVTVALASFVAVIRVVGEVMARHDVDAAWDEALATAADDLLLAATPSDVDATSAMARSALVRVGPEASGGLVAVPVPVDGNDVEISISDGDRDLATGLVTRLGRLDATAELVRERIAGEERFRQLAERTRDGIYLRGVGGAITYANTAVARLVPGLAGLERGAFTPDIDLFNPEDHARVRAAAQQGWVDRPVRTRIVDPHGEERWIELEEVPFIREAGRVTVVQGTIHDVTAQRQQEDALRVALEQQEEATARLERVDQLRATFLAAVSHELRTPLAAVLGSARTLAEHRDRLDAEQSALLADAVTRQSDRLGQLLDDLLDVERLSRGMIVAERRPTRVLSLLRTVANQHDRDGVRPTVAGPDVIADVDAAQIERVVDNLVRNAHKHTPAGTVVRMELVTRPDGIEIVVEDDGPGVPQHLAAALFAPFVQGPDAARAASSGTGIGLSLVQRFTELHDGSVTLERGAAGGARFVVVLPAAVTLPRAVQAHG